jgi:hypothetical protein
MYRTGGSILLYNKAIKEQPCSEKEQKKVYLSKIHINNKTVRLRFVVGHNGGLSSHVRKCIEKSNEQDLKHLTRGYSLYHVKGMVFILFFIYDT